MSRGLLHSQSKRVANINHYHGGGKINRNEEGINSTPQLEEYGVSKEFLFNKKERPNLKHQSFTQGKTPPEIIQDAYDVYDDHEDYIISRNNNLGP